ncbi:hypothetical protein P280DRAFT_516842 [Massarina eburnea CBS 473.64]|uniref:Uncharacterized protein n=1 Tax=Massarina eburnea CBS 473.64 TaxID=1395130 RepID=A0A6A6S3D4_9PLEO|nr:hypothetical protein P280DRAFT_516842 [Massarina eburnea CBS 473.64]
MSQDQSTEPPALPSSPALPPLYNESGTSVPYTQSYELPPAYTGLRSADDDIDRLYNIVSNQQERIEAQTRINEEMEQFLEWQNSRVQDTLRSANFLHMRIAEEELIRDRECSSLRNQVTEQHSTIRWQNATIRGLQKKVDNLDKTVNTLESWLVHNDSRVEEMQERVGKTSARERELLRLCGNMSDRYEGRFKRLEEEIERMEGESEDMNEGNVEKTKDTKKTMGEEMNGKPLQGILRNGKEVEMEDMRIRWADDTGVERRLVRLGKAEETEYEAIAQEEKEEGSEALWIGEGLSMVGIVACVGFLIWLGLCVNPETGM